MTEPTFTGPKWRKPAPLGYANAVDSVGAVASPLLAGFSLTTVVLISDDQADFRWPGAAILALAVAAVLLLGAVECAFNARKYIWSADDVRAWWPDMEDGSNREQLLRAQQDRAFHRWQAWSLWTRRAYNVGIIALLVALGLALPPKHGTDTQSSLRWVASGVAFLSCAGEIAWFAIAQITTKRNR